jgi:hypothetical protein
VFENEDALEAHQNAPHFKKLIAGEALPKLAKRERAQYEECSDFGPLLGLAVSDGGLRGA